METATGSGSDPALPHEDAAKGQAGAGGDAVSREAEARERADPLGLETAEEAKPEPLSSPARPQAPVDVTSSAMLAAVEDLPLAEEVELKDLPDEELMKFCQDGDELAFNELFERYQGPALSFIYRMVGDRARTEALGQEAFLRIFKDAKSYQYPRSFATWFYTIVRNLCKNELRWRSRHPTVSIEENVDRSAGGEGDGLHIGDNLRSKSTDPLEQLVGDELVTKLRDSLESLPEQEREILILNRFQGLKYREIAEVVGLPVGTVRSKIHTALERLRKSVKDYL
ncbi:MAG: sigma-70 family RNA polymerase sigma factor [Planctomycetota bacterium]|nr:sigma-70 family RNA polymerase sigma factor [Planctomycetota bacterium]